MSARVGGYLGGGALALCVLAGCSGVGDPIVVGADAGLIADAADLEVQDSAGPVRPSPTKVPPPENTYCDAVEDWRPRWEADENELLELLNVIRSQPRAYCGPSFQPASPLSKDPALRCVARLHAMEITNQGNNEGPSIYRRTPVERLFRAGVLAPSFEITISGADSAEEAFAHWTRDVDAAQYACPVLLERSCTLTGAGRYNRNWVIAVGGDCDLDPFRPRGPSP